MAEEKTDFLGDILKSYDLDSLILAFCLSMLRSYSRDPFGFFRHSGNHFGLYRDISLEESPGHKRLFRATPPHPPLLLGQDHPQAEDSDRAPDVTTSVDQPTRARVPPVRLSSFRSDRDPPRGPRSVQTPPPPYESVLLAFEEACMVPQVGAAASRD
ncbi:hypothetical protein AGOR_G00110180 [Albula goreensis]|uniref:Uncharacterized protein n=1 Tax=Albula goreensis TaxID=1534307 RepID=A0A8T3DE46_9TELE|nr:hypothetical protein AGOR_G00110180 [Albula goreensis]